ncbi:MAG: nitroreductase family protein [Dehalococcoidales bacterium]|nr:nitroreductase family protein [Dehalococcoidales bacterium]
MDVYEAVTRRRSIRRFKDTPVDHAILERCVNAARLAPTAINSQLCEYIIVDDEHMLSKVLDAVVMWAGVPRPEDGWSTEQRPKAYVVTLINTGLAAELGAGRENTNYDAALAVENTVLVAQEQGLGSCVLTGINRKKLRRALNIPDRYEIAILLALGFPDESPVVEVATGSVERWVDDKGALHVPKRRLEDVLHRNRFSE